MNENYKYLELLREYCMRVSNSELELNHLSESAHAARIANLLQDYMEINSAFLETASLEQVTSEVLEMLYVRYYGTPKASDKRTQQGR